MLHAESFQEDADVSYVFEVYRNCRGILENVMIRLFRQDTKKVFSFECFLDCMFF